MSSELCIMDFFSLLCLSKICFIYRLDILENRIDRLQEQAPEGEELILELILIELNHNQETPFDYFVPNKF